MKVFVAEERERGYNSPTDYHWCDNDELLMFGQFQLGNGNSFEVSMCGIKSRSFTTHILVKDLDINEDFYRKLITESVERAMNCKIDRNDDSINEIVNELLGKANQFNDGDKVKCLGRTLFNAISS